MEEEAWAGGRREGELALIDCKTASDRMCPWFQQLVSGAGGMEVSNWCSFKLDEEILEALVPAGNAS